MVSIKVSTHPALLTLNMRRSHNIDMAAIVVNGHAEEGINGEGSLPFVDLEHVRLLCTITVSHYVLAWEVVSFIFADVKSVPFVDDDVIS